MMMTERKSKKSGMPRAFAFLLGLTGSALLGGYFGGAYYYSNHYFPNTMVGGISCGNKTSDYVETRNMQTGSDYLLTVLDRKGGRFHIAGMDFDYTYLAKGEEAAILKAQNSFAWPVEIFRSHFKELDRSFSYDSLKLMKQVSRLDLFSESYIEAPENAYLDISADGYRIVEDTPGCTPIADEVYAKISEAVDSQETTVILSDRCYVPPEITADNQELQDRLAKLDAYAAVSVHYEIDGVDENLTPDKIFSMLDFEEDGTISVNERKLERYVQYLASTYNTYGDVREFKTSNGDVVRIGGGDYGWVINKAKEKEQLLEDFAGGKAVSREPVFSQRAVKSGLDDIADTYIEIDYTNQHMWYYKEGSLVVDTDIVSGNINRGNGSPDGVFKIAYCQRNATLVGEDYASKVKYFMPFAYNVGIHDADWRNTFGGEIYKRNGSHGCINAPEEAARTIIDTVDIGTPVIAYYREPVQLTAENTRISNAFSYVDPETLRKTETAPESDSPAEPAQ